MTFVPRIPRPSFAPGALMNAFPIAWMWYGLGLLFSGWVVQKIMLVLLFVSLPVIGYHFILPKISSRISRLWVALFFTINPFVYTRFLAGQWGILFAYLFAPIAFSQILALIPTRDAHDEPTSLVRRAYLPASLALVFAFSPHIGMMLLIVTAMAYLWCLIAIRGSWRNVLKGGLIHGAIFAVLTSYWTIPAWLQRNASVVGSFGSQHWEAFRTASHSVIGTIGNVLTLYGFWGERNPWATQFIWLNQSWSFLTIVSGCLIAAVVLTGLISSVRNRATRSSSLFLFVILIASIIFSCGIGDGPLRPFNLWLFEHISFWRGFRDSQKWSALIGIVYAYFAGTGLQFILHYFKHKIIQCAVVIVSGLAVIIYSSPMLFGFSGQLQPSWYPQAWDQVDEVLKADAGCKAIFLPWHMYYPSHSAHGILIANPAKSFFHCEMITSQNVELDGIRVQEPFNPAYNAIEGVVTGSDHWSLEMGLEVLRQAGIHYVIAADIMEGQDSLKYEFIQAQGIQAQDFGGTVLYRF